MNYTLLLLALVALVTCDTSYLVTSNDTIQVDSDICRQDQLYCDNNCVPLLWRCDKFMDCEDGADERDCDKCLSNQFKCADRSQCIPLSSRCDTFADCSDQSDEENCNTCSGVEFECDRNRCIPQSFRCDSKHDCTDRTDELDCGECFAGEFKCANNRCIDSSQKCDGSDDCGDGSDEPSTCYNVGPDAPSQKTPLDNNSAVSPCSTAHMNCNMNSECKQEMDNYRKVCEKQMASPQMMTCSKSCYNAYYMLLSKQPHGKELLDRECNELYVAHVELSCIRQPAAMSCMNEVTKCSQNNMCEKMYRRYSSSCKEVLDQHDPCSEVCLTDYQILRESPLAKDIVSNCIEVNTTIPMRCGATQMSTSRGNGDSACSKLYTAALTLSMVVALFTGS